LTSIKECPRQRADDPGMPAAVPAPLTGRLARERKLVRAMIGVSCRDRHHARGLCADCAELAGYCDLRLRGCPFGAAKPTCARCKVHCYRREMRERVREVMRHAGPRILWRHPWLAFLHEVLDARRPTPGLARGPGAPRP
jgi:hypothetical protein